jgi:hypothetical protein
MLPVRLFLPLFERARIAPYYPESHYGKKGEE